MFVCVILILIGSCKSNYNTITITTALKFGWCKQMCDLNHVVE